MDSKSRVFSLIAISSYFFKTGLFFISMSFCKRISCSISFGVPLELTGNYRRSSSIMIYLSLSISSQNDILSYSISSLVLHLTQTTPSPLFMNLNCSTKFVFSLVSIFVAIVKVLRPSGSAARATANASPVFRSPEAAVTQRIIVFSYSTQNFQIFLINVSIPSP